MKKRIFIAEDDPDILFALNIILSNEGYDVEASTYGKAVLEEGYVVPDLFILDKRMPDIDGLDICRYLRSHGNTEHIPIIMISASPRFGPQAKAAGANDFLEKPFHMHDLIDMVAKYINGSITA